MVKKWICWLMTALMLLTLAGCGAGEKAEATAAPVVEAEPLDMARLEQTATWLVDTIPEANFGTIGGEWLILGLARSGLEIPESYFTVYGENLAAYTAQQDGVLHNRKYTEYSRVILAWTAMGRDATDVGDFDLTQPLADFNQTVFQGINGPIFALLALDSGNYSIPEYTGEGVQATKEGYLTYILTAQTSDGGWTLSGDTADVDLTAMALQALAKYQDRPDVTEAVEKALELLSKKQDTTGGFPVADGETSESLAQVIVALTELGIPLTDARFVKDGHTVLDRLLEFQMESGGFRHIPEGEEDLMATEQSFYALVAVARAERGDSTLYTMTP